MSSSNADPPRDAADHPKPEHGSSDADAVRLPGSARSTTEFRSSRSEAGSKPAAAATVATSIGDTGDLGERWLGDFRLLRRLGRGGMAEVYLAEQRSIDRAVAIKVLRAEFVADEVHLKRFAQEARAAGGLNHPNIVQIYTIGEADGVHFIAQEYVQGLNLAQYLQRNGPPDARGALHIMKQAAQALQAAGEAGIIHRDIKPENILINQKGIVKVTDFGLARLTLGERVHLTQDGLTMGTPLYMSPEQINGGELDARSDIYSFGVTCYHLLTGRPPFRGETAMSLAVQHVNEKPLPLDRIRPDLPPGLCRIVERMMAKSPKSRYADAATLLNDMQRVADNIGDEPPAAAMARLAHLMTHGASHNAGLPGPFSRLPGGRVVQSIIALAAACILLAATSAVVGWWMRPDDPLAVEPRIKTSERPQPSVIEQYGRAFLLVDDEQAWLAVLQYFPEEESFGELARAQLARLYLQQDRFDDAEKLFAEFATPAQKDSRLRARGYAGLAIIAAAKGKHLESHQIIVEQLLPLQEVLDDTSRELVVEAIGYNRAALGRQVEPDLENRFRPPPDRNETPGRN
ncbi:MAG: serine/threonine-protein kinase [Planctomycetaceae bacterium]